MNIDNRIIKSILLLGVLFSSVFSKAQMLDNYIKIAKKNNSKIKLAISNYEITKEKVNEVGNLDNTNLIFGFFASTPETRVGAQLFKVGATQKLPWFGELRTKKETQKAMANVRQYDIELSKREIEYQVKKAYYDIYQQLAITAILKDNEQVLKTYEVMALAALSNNRATMSDVLRIRVQINELHSKIFQNVNNIATLKSNFNRLLQRVETLPVQVTDSLNVLDISVDYNTINQHPSVVKLAKMDTVFQLEKKLIRIDKKPKLSIGLDYILVDKRDITINENGKDIVMPKIALAIPLFNKRFSSQIKQIQFEEIRLKEEIINQKNTLKIALDKAVLDIDNAILSVLSAQKNKTEIQRAINVDLKAYETGILDYDKVLRLQLQKIQFQLKEVEAIKRAFIAKAGVDYLLN
jgi:outer membrane protein TolC